MKKHSIVSAAIAASLLIFGSLTVGHAIAGPPPREAKVITADEAAKKYPPPNGQKSYPAGMDAGVADDIGSATHTGFVKSPYSTRVYDCRKVAHGALVLDDGANKVFVRP